MTKGNNTKTTSLRTRILKKKITKISKHNKTKASSSYRNTNTPISKSSTINLQKKTKVKREEKKMIILSITTKANFTFHTSAVLEPNMMATMTTDSPIQMSNINMESIQRVRTRDKW